MRAMSLAPRSSDLLTHIPPRRRHRCTLPPGCSAAACTAQRGTAPHRTASHHRLPRLASPAARRGAGDARRSAVCCRAVRVDVRGHLLGFLTPRLQRRFDKAVFLGRHFAQTLSHLLRFLRRFSLPLPRKLVLDF